MNLVRKMMDRSLQKIDFLEENKHLGKTLMAISLLEETWSYRRYESRRIWMTRFEMLKDFKGLILRLIK